MAKDTVNRDILFAAVTVYVETDYETLSPTALSRYICALRELLRRCQAEFEREDLEAEAAPAPRPARPGRQRRGKKQPGFTAWDVPPELRAKAAELRANLARAIEAKNQGERYRIYEEALELTKDEDGMHPMWAARFLDVHEQTLYSYYRNRKPEQPSRASRVEALMKGV